MQQGLAASKVFDLRSQAEFIFRPLGDLRLPVNSSRLTAEPQLSFRQPTMYMIAWYFNNFIEISIRKYLNSRPQYPPILAATT